MKMNMEALIETRAYIEFLEGELGMEVE